MNDETPLDDPFVGAFCSTAAVHGGGNAAWQPGVHDAGAGAACAGSCGGGAHGMGNMSGMTFRKSDGRRFGSEILKQSVYGDTSFNTILKEGMKDYFQEFDGKRMSDDELQSMNCFLMPQAA